MSDKPKKPKPPVVVDSPWLCMDEAAAYLKYRTENAANTVRGMLADAGVPMYRRNGKALLVHRDDLNEWIFTGDCIEGRRRQIRHVKEHAKLRRGFNPAALPPREGRGRPRKRKSRAERLEDAEQQARLAHPANVPPLPETEEVPCP